MVMEGEPHFGVRQTLGFNFTCVPFILPIDIY